MLKVFPNVVLNTSGFRMDQDLPMDIHSRTWDLGVNDWLNMSSNWKEGRMSGMVSVDSLTIHLHTENNCPWIAFGAETGEPAARRATRRLNSLLDHDAETALHKEL